MVLSAIRTLPQCGKEIVQDLVAKCTTGLRWHDERQRGAGARGAILL